MFHFSKLIPNGSSRNYNASGITNQYPSVCLQKNIHRGGKKLKKPSHLAELSFTSDIVNQWFKTSNSLSWKHHFCRFPLDQDIPYERGVKGSIALWLKKVNSYRVNKLRTIVLFEAEFNFINKAVSRKLAHAAEKKKCLAIKQHGSRKSH